MTTLTIMLLAAFCMGWRGDQLWRHRQDAKARTARQQDNVRAWLE